MPGRARVPHDDGDIKKMNEEKGKKRARRASSRSSPTRRAGANGNIPAFGQITEDNYEIYVDVAKKDVLVFDPENLHGEEGELKKYSGMFKEAAAELKREERRWWRRTRTSRTRWTTMPMVWIDAREFEPKENWAARAFPRSCCRGGSARGR